MTEEKITKVVKMEDILKDSDQQLKSALTENGKNTRQDKSKKKDIIPQGKPKSGRFWKTPKKKFSSIIKTKGLKQTLEKRKALKEKLEKAKEASKAIKEAKAAETELKKQRRRENLAKQEENRKKSEVVQVITNTKKLKKMKKKQLRYIEKRDTTVVQK